MLTPSALSTYHTRHLCLLAAVASLLLFGSILHLLPFHRRLISPLGNYGQVDTPRDRQVLEIQGLTLGPEFARPADAQPNTNNVIWLMDALKVRFQQILFPDADESPGYPNCTFIPARYAKTALGPEKADHSWRHDERSSIVSFAINLRNSEAIIPAQAMALLEAAAYLLQNNKVYVSIYENDSDDKTRPLLSDLGAALLATGVDGLAITSSNMLSNFGKQDRIVMLSEIRNLALAPLMPYASSEKSSDTLVFINDVVTCTSDILELVHQQRLHQAGMSFGMDWGAVTRRTRPGELGYLQEDDPEFNPENPPSTKISRFYDTWVGRGISGDCVYDWANPGGFNPKSDNESWVADAYVTENATIHQRWLDGLAFPAYSGWGGMAAFDASLFTNEHLRFRSSVSTGWNGGNAAGALGSWGQLVSSDEYLKSDCPGASECEYVARDIWNMRQGKARIVLAPQARTTYSLEDWLVMGDTVPMTRREGPDLLGEDIINWSDVSIPESVVCIASRDAHGAHIHPWLDSNHRTRVDPLWRPPSSIVITANERALDEQATAHPKLR